MVQIISQGFVNVLIEHHSKQKWGYISSQADILYGDVKNKSPKRIAVHPADDHRLLREFSEHILRHHPPCGENRPVSRPPSWTATPWEKAREIDGKIYGEKTW